MMQNLDVNVGIENRAKKGEKGAEKALNAAAGKFLAATRMKESFSLDFEALFLDMFTEVAAPAAPRAEAQRSAEPIGSAVVAAPRIETSAAPRAAEQRRETVSPEPPAERKAATTDEERAGETMSGGTNAETAGAEAGSGAEGAEAPEAEAAGETASAENPEALKTQVRLVRVELSARLEKKLSAEELQSLKEKIDDLLSKDELSIGVLVSEILKIVAEIAGPEAPAEAVGEMKDLDAEQTRKFFKKLLKEIGKAVEQALGAPESPAEAIESPKVEARVEQALQKIVAKMTPVSEETAAPERRSLVEVSQEAIRPQEAVEETRTEAPKAAESKSVSVRLQTIEMNLEKAVERTLADANQEMAAALELKPKTKATGPVITALPSAVEGVAEAGRAGRSSEGQSNSWQSAYNQNSSQKGLDGSARAEKSASNLRPQTAPVFDQIVQNMKVAVSEGKTEATIRLKPELLGRVEMKITVEDGKVNVRFTAENNAVRAAITENIQDLKKNLAEAGLEVETVNVALAGEFGDADTENREKEDGPARAARGAYAGEEEEEEESFSDVARAVVDGSTVRYVA